MTKDEIKKELETLEGQLKTSMDKFDDLTNDETNGDLFTDIQADIDTARGNISDALERLDDFEEPVEDNTGEAEENSGD